MSLMKGFSPSPVSLAFAGIQWDPLSKLGLSEPERATLRAAEDNPMEYTIADREEAAAYARILLKVLAETSGTSGPSSRVSRVTEPMLPDDEALQLLYVDTMGVVTHYAITKLHEIIVCLEEKPERSGVSITTTFYNADGSLPDDWRPLLRMLHMGGSGDVFAQRGAALILACILMEGCPSQRATRSPAKNLKPAAVEEPLQALVSWIASQLQSSTASSLTLVTSTITLLMNCPEARLIFQNSGGIGYLAKHCKTKPAPTASSSPSKPRTQTGQASVQQLYELCFCLWTLSYECNSSASVRMQFARDGAVPALVDLIATAPREKVVRVALSALRNLATCTATLSPVGKKEIDGKNFLTEMIGCGLLKHVDLMKERQWTDPDMLEDLDILHRLLHENYKEMTRWDVYKAEVESGHLSWGIVHSEKFFKENTKRIEGPDGDFAILRMLIKLVLSDDEEVATIACYDIGEFVRYYPNGRAIAKRLGAKDLIMKMIDHENSDLQRHALQCISKIMVQNWAAVQ